MGICMWVGFNNHHRAYFKQAICYFIVEDVVLERNRLEQLLTRINFVNNSEVTDEKRKDRLWKLRHWLSTIGANFLKVPPEEHQTVDKIIFAFWGKVGPRVYTSKNLAKWGFKLWGRASSS